MPAFLGEFLVLELDRRRTGPLIAPDGVAHIQEPPIAGVAVGDERRLGHARHRFDPADHVGVTRKPGVGKPEVGGDRAVSGHVEGVKAHSRRHPQRDHVVDARRRDYAVLGAGAEDVHQSGHGEFSPELALTGQVDGPPAADHFVFRREAQQRKSPTT